MDPATANLPRILCLHGGGTSAMIFKIQTRRLQWALRSRFRFVFLDAPFESGAGPGVLPVFEGCGPYHRWMAVEGEDQERAQQIVREKIKGGVKEDGGDFWGVLGFSQGARMAAGLLADEEEGGAVGMPEWRFGVLLCGSYPPLSLSSSRDSNRRDSPVKSDFHGEIREPDNEEIIHIPTVHVHGAFDPHLEKGRRLARFFNYETASVMEFKMGHHLPGAAGDTTSDKGDTQRIVDAILKACGKEPMEGQASGGSTTPLEAGVT